MVKIELLRQILISLRRGALRAFGVAGSESDGPSTRQHVWGHCFESRRPGCLAQSRAFDNVAVVGRDLRAPVWVG